jgi:heterodisulfide reductase subunit A-like polyferredoxin
MKDEGEYGEQLRSGYVAITDAALCVGCGLCQESCFFDARSVENGTLHLADDQCFGCGKCIGTCPEQAIRLEFRAGRGVPIPSAV